MKYIILLFSCTLFMLACSKEDNSLPEDENLTSLAEATIGPSGGILETENFSLSVPAGSFTTLTELKLYEWTGDNMIGDKSITPVYLVEGLPGDYTIALEIAVMTDEAIEGEPYIAIGRDYLYPGDEEEMPFFRLLQADESSGMIQCELPVPENSLKAGNMNFLKTTAGYTIPLKTYFCGVKGYEPPAYSVNKHFKMVISSDIKEKVLLLASMSKALESSWDSLKVLGFDCDLLPYPIEVFMMNFPSDMKNRLCMFWPEFSQVYLVYDYSGSLPPNLSPAYMQATTREFSHGLFSSYDRNYFTTQDNTPKANPERFWFHHAAACWSEQLLFNTDSLDEDFFPLEYWYLSDTTRSALEGMQAGAGNDLQSSRKHGIAMSSFIQYLADNYRKSVMIRMYQEINNQKHPVEAIKNSVADPVNTWWPEYIKELMEGKIYDFSSDAYTYDEPEISSGVFSIQSANDTLKIFQDDYPDLSAKVFKVKPGKEVVDTTTHILFSVSDAGGKPEDATVLVFGSKANEDKLKYLGQGTEFTIKKAGKLLKEDYIDFFGIVVNSHNQAPSYNGSRSLSLKIQLTKDVVIDLNWASIKVKLNSDYEYTDGSTSGGVYIYADAELRAGELKDYVFTSTWSVPVSTGTSSGTFMIYFDPDRFPRYIDTYSITETIKLTDTRTYTITGENVDLYGYKESYGTYTFSAGGESTCDYITTADEVFTGTGGWGYFTTGVPVCDNNSYIEINMGYQ